MSTPVRMAVLFWGALLGLAGCATVSEEAVFSDVQSSVRDRTGYRASWRSLEDEKVDHALQERLRRLQDKELSIEDAVQIALLNSPRMQATYEELAIRRADLIDAGLLRNPTIDAEVKLVEGGPGEVIELLLVQPVLDAIFIPMKRKVATAELESAKLRVTRDALRQIGQTRRSYYRVQAAEQTVEVLSSVVRATLASAETARALFAAGNIPELELRREEALHEQARLDLAAAQLAVEERREALNRQLGLWGRETAWRVPSRLPAVPEEPPELEDLERRAIRSSLDVAQARREMVALGERLGLTRITSIVRDGEVGVAAEREPDGTWAVGPAIALEIPIFNHGQAAVPRAEAMMRRAEYGLIDAAIRVRARSRQAARNARSLWRRVRHYEQTLLPLRRKVLEQTQRQYNAMQIGTFEVLTAKRREIETASGYVETLRDYWLAASNLDQILSGSLPEGSGPIGAGAAGMRAGSGAEAQGGH